jgi:hypothetical protein
MSSLGQYFTDILQKHFLIQTTRGQVTRLVLNWMQKMLSLIHHEGSF